MNSFSSTAFKTALLKILECSWTIRLKTNKKIFHYSVLTKQLFPHFLNLRNDIPIGISRLKQLYIYIHSRVWIKWLQVDNFDEKPIGNSNMQVFIKVQISDMTCDDKPRCLYFKIYPGIHRWFAQTFGFAPDIRRWAVANSSVVLPMVAWVWVSQQVLLHLRREK